MILLNLLNIFVRNGSNSDTVIQYVSLYGVYKAQKKHLFHFTATPFLTIIYRKNTIHLSVCRVMNPILLHNSVPFLGACSEQTTTTMT